MPETDKLNVIADDVADLKRSADRMARWADSHDERHGDEADMLGRVLDSMEGHEGNHHGTASTLKQGGAIGTSLAVLGLLAEVLRRLIF